MLMDEMNYCDFGYGCESGYGGGYLEDGARDFRVPQVTESESADGAENVDGADLSTNEKKEVIEKYKDLMDLWAQIVEVGVSLDPQVLNQLRQQLLAMMLDLKILGKDGKCDLNKLFELCGAIVAYKEKAGVKKEYPKRTEFIGSIAELEENELYLFDGLSSRGNKELGDYLYGIGIIMDNEIVYSTIFENDPIVMRNGKVENGRHRMATRAILAKCGYHMLHEWLIPKTETDNR